MVRTGFRYLFIPLLATIILGAFTGTGSTMVSGPCSNCHTMHNSQNGQPMTFDGSAVPYPYLTRASCIGCHGQGGTSNIVAGIPQVNHTDTDDLAAGNFAYMLGLNGSGVDDSKGHNVIDFGNLEDTLTYPPGGYDKMPSADALTCAGVYGCHGNTNDYGNSDPMKAIAGAHHTIDTDLTGETVGKSYRFLLGVIGREVDDWQNTDKGHHNEYYGKTTPYEQECGNCHWGHLPAGSTITSLCTTCHVDMHKIDTSGDNIWLRHPSDILIPDEGEYAAYTEYNVDAPVGRQTVPTDISDTVTPGSDVVTCLSCHFAHGSNYSDLLRWDYDQMVADGGSSTEGCFICHSTKDD